MKEKECNGPTATIIPPNITKEERAVVLKGIEAQVNRIAWSLGMSKSRRYVLSFEEGQE